MNPHVQPGQFSNGSTAARRQRAGDLNKRDSNNFSKKTVVQIKTRLF